jgi:hypothetical protein
LLAGLAIENLLKGVVVIRYPIEEAHGRRKMPWGRSGHDLCALAALAGFVVNQTDREFLHRLSQFVAWRGRYPFPTRMDLDSEVEIRLDEVVKARDLVGRLEAHLPVPIEP